jgi:chemotaxis protein methyltransferase CheR
VDFQEFKNRVARELKLDLNSYKDGQLQRRINTLMTRKKINTYADYYRVISGDRAHFGDFVDYLTINVTEFFRDSRAFQQLEQKVLPELLAGNSRLKIWSAACSNGAEPYSLAIILDELTPGRHHRIEATDLDPNILRTAAEGSYPPDLLRNVPAVRREKYFQRENGRYILVQEIRRRVAFRRHDLLADPFGEGFDLIVCRNVQIYFTKEAQWRVNSRFCRALKPGGVLFLGASETIFSPAELGLERTAICFYRRTGSGGRIKQGVEKKQ